MNFFYAGIAIIGLIINLFLLAACGMELYVGDEEEDGALLIAAALLGIDILTAIGCLTFAFQ